MKRRWVDWVVGIGIGIVIGLGVLVYFVFVHSEGTIDAPQVNEGRTTTGGTTTPAPPAKETGRETTAPEREESTPPPKPEKKPVPVVPVIGGAPPTDAGPKQLTFRKGEKVRFEIETEEPFSFEIKGLNIQQSIESSSIISFKATKAGQFPVIATATLIGVADLRIKPSR
jgi:heme/copper-type cytochrome/quinol oxidase subunit 2